MTNEELYVLQLLRAYPRIEKRILQRGILLAGRVSGRSPHQAERIYDVTLLLCKSIHALRRIVGQVQQIVRAGIQRDR